MVKTNNLAEASVVIDGKLAQEYDTGEEDGIDTAARYIESKPGANYSIHIDVRKDFLLRSSDCLACYLTIDGHNECRPLPLQGDGSSLTFNLGGTCSTENGRHLEKPYNFTDITSSEEGSQLVTKSEIGMIRVEIWKATYDLAREIEPRGPTSFNPITHISDKTTKWGRIYHITSLGEGREIEESEHGNHQPINKLGSTPLSTSTFLYRSREALKELGGILPTDPLPVRQNELPEEKRLMDERLGRFFDKTVTTQTPNRGAETNRVSYSTLFLPPKLFEPQYFSAGPTLSDDGLDECF